MQDNFYYISCWSKEIRYNTLVSNEFHSVKGLSARPSDFDGMLGTELPVFMYTNENFNRYVAF